MGGPTAVRCSEQWQNSIEVKANRPNIDIDTMHHGMEFFWPVATNLLQEFNMTPITILVHTTVEFGGDAGPIFALLEACIHLSQCLMIRLRRSRKPLTPVATCASIGIGTSFSSGLSARDDLNLLGRRTPIDVAPVKNTSSITERMVGFSWGRVTSRE